jgi:hypothetical protein
MSDIDFDFGGVWPKEIIKSNRDCLYVLVRNVTLLLLLLSRLLPEHCFYNYNVRLKEQYSTAWHWHCLVLVTGIFTKR